MTLKALLSLTLMLCAAPGASCEALGPTLTYGAAAGADLLSTHQALRVAGAQEANPLLRGNLKQQIALKLGTTAVMVYFDLKLQEHGHFKAAWVMRGLWIVLHALVVRHNLLAGR